MYRLPPSVSDLNSYGQLPRESDKRHFDIQQDLQKYKQIDQMSIYTRTQQLNGTTVKPENKGNSNFYSFL
jgi:hypothetical protein